MSDKHFILSTNKVEAFDYARDNLPDVPLKNIVLASHPEVFAGCFGAGFNDKAHILKSADDKVVKELKFILESRGEINPYPSIIFEKKKHTFLCVVGIGANNSYLVERHEADSFGMLPSRVAYGSDIIIDDEGRVRKNRLGAIFSE